MCYTGIDYEYSIYKKRQLSSIVHIDFKNMRTKLHIHRLFFDNIFNKILSLQIVYL